MQEAYGTPEESKGEFNAISVRVVCFIYCHVGTKSVESDVWMDMDEGK